MQPCPEQQQQSPAAAKKDFRSQQCSEADDAPYEASELIQIWRFRLLG